MKFNRIFLPVVLCNLLAQFAVIFTLPEQVPVHGNAAGVIDGWGPRWTTPLLGFLPVLLLGGTTLYRHLTRDNPRIARNRRVEQIVFSVLILFFLVISWFPMVMARMGADDRLPVELLVGLPLGVLMIVISNFMGVIKQNRFLGIRTKWTLSNEEVWRRTHRRAAYWGLAAGVTVIALCLTAYFTGRMVVALAGLIASALMIALVPTVDSWLIYRNVIGEERHKS